MIAAEADVTIDRPVEEVFAWLTDVKNHPRWDDSSIAMDKLDDGPWRAGTHFREVRKIVPGRTIEVRSEVADLKPNESFDIRSLSGPPFNGHWRFSRQESGTRLRWNGEMRLTGPARIFEPLIRRSFRKSVARNFARMKTIIESEPAVNGVP